MEKKSKKKLNKYKIKLFYSLFFFFFLIDLTISQYLIQRLKELGVEHAFGVCGDYIIGFLEIMLQLKKKVIYKNIYKKKINLIKKGP